MMWIVLWIDAAGNVCEVYTYTSQNNANAAAAVLAARGGNFTITTFNTPFSTDQQPGGGEVHS